MISDSESQQGCAGAPSWVRVRVRGGEEGRNTCAHTLRGPGVENRLGTGSRSYMDLAAAQQASLKRKGLSVGLVR